jgi:hypothetical protein
MSMLSSINSRIIKELILDAKQRVIIATPGIQKEVAEAILSFRDEKGESNIKVILDTSEEVCRLGYSDIDAVNMLRKREVKVCQTSGLRIGILICDDTAWIFSPTALYIQSEAQSSDTPNAIRIQSSSVDDIAMRLSENERIKAIERGVISSNEIPIRTEIGDLLLTEDEYIEVKTSLEQAPPVPFDIARQVRVFEPYIQYVEISLLGAAIQRKRVTLPSSIVNLGTNAEIENRINTTFSLIERNSSLSSRTLDRELDRIRDAFTRSLGKPFERVMLKAQRKRFDDAMEKFKEKVKKHEEGLRKELEAHIKKSLQSLVDYYLPLVKENPPLGLSGQIISKKPADKIAKKWLENELSPSFPDASFLLKETNIKVVVLFRDVTYETLKDEDFREQIREKFEYIDWDKPFKEFQALAEKKKKDDKTS